MIAKKLLSDEPHDEGFHALVMKTNLRRIQFDGLWTVIVRAALALEHELGEINYSKVLPYLSDTALGQELASLLNGTANFETSYRMGELEFLAQSGMKTSPLDRLLDLPAELRIGCLVEILKPVGAFKKRARSPEDPNIMPFEKVIPLINRKEVNIHASYSGSLRAAAFGLVRIGIIGRFTNLGFMAIPIAGIAAAVFVAWWFLPLGIIAAILCFKYTRRLASREVLRRALTDEDFFNEMRRMKVIWLEYARIV